MGYVAITLLKWLIRIAFVTAGLFAFIVILNFAISLFFVTLNQNVLTDLFAIIQIWLPFNLNTLLAWLITAVLAFMTYKLAIMAISWINRLIGMDGST